MKRNKQCIEHGRDILMDVKNGTKF